MEAWLKTVFEYLYIAIGSIGLAIIVWRVVLTVYRLLKLEFSRLRHASIYRKRELHRGHQVISHFLEKEVEKFNLSE